MMWRVFLMNKKSLDMKKEDGNKTSKNIATANLKDKNSESSLFEISKCKEAIE